jgi:hypothetical protein
MHHGRGLLWPVFEVLVCFVPGVIGGALRRRWVGLRLTLLGFCLGVALHYQYGRTFYVYGGHLSACSSNVKSIGMALEMYSTGDGGGHYPASLGQLVPNYLGAIPKCTGSSSASYSYLTGKDAPGNELDFQDYYFVMCEGDWHVAGGGSVNYPQYSVLEGLAEGRKSEPSSSWYDWYEWKRY